MTWSDFGTWLGTLFSVAGAYIAIRQAREAKSFAENAKEIRDDIVSKHEHGELRNLDEVLTSAHRAMDKYGPGSKPTSRRGASPHEDAAKVRALTAALDRHREMLSQGFGTSCEGVRDRLNNLLTSFGVTEDADERNRCGLAIYLEITTFSGNVKHILDKKVFGATAKGT